MARSKEYVDHTETVRVIWMDSMEETYMANSTRVDNGELIIYGAIKAESGKHEPDQHFPLANIRRWFKERNGS
jgi:hypothetical protein